MYVKGIFTISLLRFGSVRVSVWIIAKTITEPQRLTLDFKHNLPTEPGGMFMGWLNASLVNVTLTTK